jgi:cyclomaltodextrinase / maltogenic alpha-amylase / neopullulanase
MSAIHTPDWVKDAVFYQIFPDRFAKSAQLVKPNNLEPWDSAPTTHGYKGGDLLGVVEHLDHIVDLGANALYFCPIFQSASNHRYHTHDYYRVDPLLGGDGALQTLLDEAHRRGLKVVLDGVFNHASRGFFYFNDILENGSDSPYIDWFDVQEYPPNAYDPSRPPGYTAWVGLPALPKLNTDNAQVREYLMQVAEHWLRQGIDGWRLDVAKEITTPGFWEEFRQRVKAINPEAYIVAEIWEADIAQPWLQGDAFDGVMNYPFAEAVLSFVAGPRIVRPHWEGRAYDLGRPLDARAYGERIQWLLGLYPWEIQLAQMNLLDSHDAARVITLSGGDAASVHLATLLLLTFPGAVSIYYGDEIGVPGGLPDYETRRTMPWEHPKQWRQEVLAYHKTLIAVRHAHPALRRGQYVQLYAAGDVYVFLRQLGAEALVVAVNSGEDAATVTFAAPALEAAGGSLVSVYGPDSAALEQGTVTLTLGARSGSIWQAVP